jgi:hypothetical protein
MLVQFKIAVTREILELSLQCGTSKNIEEVGKNCAIALAVKDIFPDVLVTDDYIYPFGINKYAKTGELKIELPQVAKDFIKVFDSLCGMPKVRRCLPEFDFEIPVSDEIISQINIGEVKALINFPQRALLSTAVQ